MNKSITHQSGLPTMPQTLIFVTGNANKLAEVKAILGDAVPSLDNKALDLPELQGTLEEITLDKARRAAEAVGASVFPYPPYLLCRLGALGAPPFSSAPPARSPLLPLCSTTVANPLLHLRSEAPS
jgi:hypothetical protein